MKKLIVKKWLTGIIVIMGGISLGACGSKEKQPTEVKNTAESSTTIQTTTTTSSSKENLTMEDAQLIAQTVAKDLHEYINGKTWSEEIVYDLPLTDTILALAFNFNRKISFTDNTITITDTGDSKYNATFQGQYVYDEDKLTERILQRAEEGIGSDKLKSIKSYSDYGTILGGYNAVPIKATLTWNGQIANPAGGGADVKDFQLPQTEYTIRITDGNLEFEANDPEGYTVSDSEIAGAVKYPLRLISSGTKLTLVEN